MREGVGQQLLPRRRRAGDAHAEAAGTDASCVARRGSSACALKFEHEKAADEKRWQCFGNMSRFTRAGTASASKNFSDSAAARNVALGNAA